MYDKETMHSLEARDYQSYSENLRKRVPYPEISQSLYLEVLRSLIGLLEEFM